VLKIFFDTNILEDRIGEDLINLGKCDISQKYFEVARYIADRSLEYDVSLNIPLIVLEEIKQHLYEGNIKHGQSIREKIKLTKKKFGSILELEYKFKYSDFSGRKTIDEQIEDYVNYIVNEFISLPINKKLYITPFPENYDRLINRAVKRQLPFFVKEKIKDAGFKDALLVESILENTNFEEDEVVLFTSDYRLAETNKYLDKGLQDKFFVTSNIDECLAIIASKRAATIETEISVRLERDSYFLSRIFESINQPLSKDTEGLEILEIQKKDVDDDYHSEYKIVAKTISNEACYLLKFNYDNVANDFSNVSYKIEND